MAKRNTRGDKQPPAIEPVNFSVDSPSLEPISVDQAEATETCSCPTCGAVHQKPAIKEIPKHLRCPICFENPEMRGRALRRKWYRQINGPVHQRCYLGTCGHEWVVEVRAEFEDDIEYKTAKVVEARL